MGVGPSGFDRVPEVTARLLKDEANVVIARTGRHPAIAELTRIRTVITGDDLYDEAGSFAEVYDRLADRVLEAAEQRRVVFAVPGSPAVGEFTVSRIRRLAADRNLTVEVIGAESFVDAICSELAIDPLEQGLQVLDGRDLPDPIPLHVPTIIAQVDLPVVAADVLARLGELVGEDAPITVATDVGGPDAQVITVPIGQLDPSIATVRTSLVVDAQPVGWWGAIDIMRRLRRECPWDAQQTHHSIIANLTEEAAELAEALAGLPAGAPNGDPDFGAYADVEEELGDVLLQVLFHIAMGEPSGGLSPDGVGQMLVEKLVRRHPHVFGDATAESAADVLEVWEQAKALERAQDIGARSLFDGVARGLHAIGKAQKVQERAAQVGFDWTDAEPVYAKLAEEIAELRSAVTGEDRLHELGDVLFTAINLARHLDVGPEVALRTAVGRFQGRMEWMESNAELAACTAAELEVLWQAAKDEEE